MCCTHITWTFHTGEDKISEDALLDDSTDATDYELSQELSFIDLDTIVAATGNFFDGNKLGEGGFGPVYKVMN